MALFAVKIKSPLDELAVKLTKALLLFTVVGALTPAPPAPSMILKVALFATYPLTVTLTTLAVLTIALPFAEMLPEEESAMLTFKVVPDPWV